MPELGTIMALIGANTNPLKSAIGNIESATNSDVGKALSPKTVSNGKVTEWQYLPSPKWELINEETFSFETSSTKTISVDSYGNDLELTDIVLMFETPKQATESAKTSPIVIYYANNNNNNNNIAYLHI